MKEKNSARTFSCGGGFTAEDTTPVSTIPTRSFLGLYTAVDTTPVSILVSAARVPAASSIRATGRDAWAVGEASLWASLPSLVPADAADVGAAVAVVFNPKYEMG